MSTRGEAILMEITLSGLGGPQKHVEIMADMETNKVRLYRAFYLDKNFIKKNTQH